MKVHLILFLGMLAPISGFAAGSCQTVDLHASHATLKFKFAGVRHEVAVVEIDSQHISVFTRKDMTSTYLLHLSSQNPGFTKFEIQNDGSLFAYEAHDDGSLKKVVYTCTYAP